MFLNDCQNHSLKKTNQLKVGVLCSVYSLAVSFGFKAGSKNCHDTWRPGRMPCSGDMQKQKNICQSQPPLVRPNLKVQWRTDLAGPAVSNKLERSRRQEPKTGPIDWGMYPTFTVLAEHKRGTKAEAKETNFISSISKHSGCYHGSQHKPRCPPPLVPSRPPCHSWGFEWGLATGDCGGGDLGWSDFSSLNAVNQISIPQPFFFQMGHLDIENWSRNPRRYLENTSCHCTSWLLPRCLDAWIISRYVKFVCFASVACNHH